MVYKDYTIEHHISHRYQMSIIYVTSAYSYEYDFDMTWI